LQDQLAAMAHQVHPHAGHLSRQFDRILRARGFSKAQRLSLLEITPAAAALLLASGEPLSSFLEQVEYRGRRLAKLGMAPSEVQSALRGFDQVFESLLSKLAGKGTSPDGADLRWVRDQLHFCAVLTLNNAFYQVREAESRAFYELFRAEVEAPELKSMIDRFAGTLKEYTGASAVRIALFDARPSPHVLRPRCFATASAPRGALLEPAWRTRYRFCWSVPMVEQAQVRGALQFAFPKQYEWLPREQELLSAAAERCWRAAEKSRLIQDLGRREEQVRRLAEHMVELEESERRRISRELHDEAGQSLLCVRLQLEMAEQDLPTGLGEVRQRLQEARTLVDHSIVEIRRLIAALSPAVLEQMGLAAGLRQVVARFRHLHPGTAVELHLPRRLELPQKSAIIVYRLLQECFNNISKYSAASHVNLSVDSADGKLCLHIEDDGVGFDVQEALSRRDCYGLSGLRERVALLGGSLVVRSLPRRSQAAVEQVSTCQPELGQALASRDGEDHGSGVIGVSRPGTSIWIEMPVAAESGGQPLGGPTGPRMSEMRLRGPRLREKRREGKGAQPPQRRRAPTGSGVT